MMLFISWWKNSFAGEKKKVSANHRYLKFVLFSSQKHFYNMYHIDKLKLPFQLFFDEVWLKSCWQNNWLCSEKIMFGINIYTCFQWYKEGFNLSLCRNVTSKSHTYNWWNGQSYSVSFLAAVSETMPSPCFPKGLCYLKAIKYIQYCMFECNITVVCSTMSTFNFYWVNHVLYC